eukprot:5294463-Prymnesium_polylepis.1
MILSRCQRYCAKSIFGRLQRTRCCSHGDRSSETLECDRQAQPAGLQLDGCASSSAMSSGAEQEVAALESHGPLDSDVGEAGRGLPRRLQHAITQQREHVESRLVHDALTALRTARPSAAYLPAAHPGVYQLLDSLAFRYPRMLAAGVL